MLIFIIWMVILSCGHKIAKGKSTSDADKCLSREERGSAVKNVFCVVTKNDVKLSCPPDKIIILLSLQFVVKNSSEFCKKRILKAGDDFCCGLKNDDVRYEGDCLQHIWNAEDKQHYKQFLFTLLRLCMNTSKCVLLSKLFNNLQKEIPNTKTYSSYFQVLYQCITPPTDPVPLCSSRSVKGHEIHIQDALTSEDSAKNTCSCGVTSQTSVTVRTVDVRSATSQLILKSDENVKRISRAQMPLFGLRDIATGHKLNIAVKPGSETNRDDRFWLLISGSSGHDVNVTCGQSKPRVVSTSLLPNGLLTGPQPTGKRVFWGFWPLIYVASGSIFTIVLVACILIAVFISHQRKKSRTRRHPCCQISLPSPADFHQDQYSSPYATVMDDHPRMPDMTSVHTLRTNEMAARHMRPPVAPPPPPPNVPGKRLGGTAYYSRNRTHTGVSCDVSELEAFLECK